MTGLCRPRPVSVNASRQSVFLNVSLLRSVAAYGFAVSAGGKPTRHRPLVPYLA